MGTDGWRCGQCGQSVSPDANFCPACGLGRDATLLDPLGVEAATTGPAEPAAARFGRRGVVAGLAVVAGLVLLVWAVTRSDDPDPGDSAAPAESTEAEDPTTSMPTTTPPTTTESSSSTATTPSVLQSLVGDEAGPVLGERVDQVLIAMIGRTLHRVDLATGEVTATEVRWPLSSAEPWSPVVIDGELVSSTGIDNLLVATDLVTGAQEQLADLDLAAGEFVQVIGPAGRDAVWVATQGQLGPSAVLEVDLTGEVRTRLDLPRPFYAVSGGEDHVYLTAPGGSWRYDTRTGAARELDGDIVAWAPEAVVVVSCAPTLECRATIETATGSIPVPGVVLGELYSGLIQVAPDLTGMLIPRLDAEAGGEFVHVDLVTGERTYIRDVGLAYYRDVVWIPDTPWIVGVDSQGGADLVALNTDTENWFELDLPPSSGASGDSVHLVLEAAG